VGPIRSGRGGLAELFFDGPIYLLKILSVSIATIHAADITWAEVSAVPLPAAYPFRIAALGGLAFIGCRRKAASPSHSLVAANMRAASKQVGFGPMAAIRVFDQDLTCLHEKSGAAADG
jgi:hypothetical protein